MQEKAPSNIQYFSIMTENIIFLILENLIPRGYAALQLKAYADFSRLLFVDKHIRDLTKHFINDLASFWKPQLRRILDTLGFEGLSEREYLRSLDDRPAITPQQLALSIIKFDYPSNAKNLAHYYHIEPKNQGFAEHHHPIISHLNCLFKLKLMDFNNQQELAALHNLSEKLETMVNFMQNMKQLKDTLPPIFLVVTQFYFILNDPSLINNDKALYQDLSNNLLANIKTKLPKISIDNNLLQELSLALLLHWPNAKKMLTKNPDHFKDCNPFEKPFRLAQFVLEKEADRVTNEATDIQKLSENGQDSVNTNPRGKKRWMDNNSSSTSFKFFDNNNPVNNTDEISPSETAPPSGQDSVNTNPLKRG
jgi:hypothetical protein